MDIIRHPIIPQKGKAWHLFMHPYFTKQASNVVSEYLDNFTEKGQTILDPFCGTGVTAIEALALRRKAVMVDLNPLATFITEQTVKKINTERFKKEFSHIQDTIGDRIIKIDNLNKNELGKETFEFWYPKGIRLPNNSDIEFVEELWTKRQLLGLSILWNSINNISDLSIRDQMKMVFSATISRVNITYNLSKSRQVGDKIKLGDGGSALFAQYRYWKPKHITELKVWDRFKDRFIRTLKAKEKWNNILGDYSVDNNFKIITGSVLDIRKYLDDGSIDYVYTDPPYGGNIAYLDLSTMWNAWLGFNISKDQRDQEIIEGGDLDKSQENYELLLTHSIQEISKVLKRDGWLSLVFAHKKLEFWNTIIDAGENTGLEFKGSTFQPTNNSSIHYKKNPANVLCSQRIATFQKTNKKSLKDKPDDLKEYILNELERACVEGDGASIDVLYNRVLDKLHDNKMIGEAKKAGYLTLEPLLTNKDLFDYNSYTKLYYVKAGKNNSQIYVKDYFKSGDEFKTILKETLYEKPLTLDEISKEVFSVFEKDVRFPIQKRDLEEVLQTVAYKNHKNGKWTLISAEQVDLQLDYVTNHKLAKINGEGLSHSEIIFRLYQIGMHLGFHSWIGKREQETASFAGKKFGDLSLSTLPIKSAKKPQLKKIEQIDMIWFDRLGIPRYAFEVEESTQITTGIERFLSLLDINIDVSGNLYIITPKSRSRKLAGVIVTSKYFGGPIYVENKVGFIYKEDLLEFYDTHIDTEFKETDLKVIFNRISSPKT